MRHNLGNIVNRNQISPDVTFHRKRLENTYYKQNKQIFKDYVQRMKGKYDDNYLNIVSQQINKHYKLYQMKILDKKYNEQKKEKGKSLNGLAIKFKMTQDRMSKLEDGSTELIKYAAVKRKM